MEKAKCVAIAEHGRINLIILKDQKGYKKFAEVLNKIDKQGCMSWYGDVRDETGKECSGLIITPKEAFWNAQIKTHQPNKATIEAIKEFDKRKAIL